MTTQVENIHIQGNEHWTKKGDAKLFLWEKRRAQNSADKRHHPVRARLVDGLAADLRSAGAGASGRDGLFRRPGLRHLVASTWRATAARPRTAASTPRSPRAPTTSRPATDYIFKTRNHTGPLLVYGISSGALRAALFAQRHPNRVKRLALDAHVWTGEGSPTLAERRRSCRSSSRPSGGRSTASSSARSSSATIPAPPTTR